MESAMKFLLVVSALFLVKGVRAGDKCPVIETVADFNLTRYAEKSWFSQRQQQTSYQPAENLYCVSATYNNEGVKNWGREATSVYNYYNVGINTDRDTPEPLCATRKNPDKEPAKLQVIPCKLPNFFAGPYWVAAVGTDYEWAIIVGGQPDVQGECGTENLCTTEEGQPKGGLWFFTRAQVASDDTLNDMEDTARSLGLCTANMLDVVQEGCTYEGQFLKQ